MKKSTNVGISITVAILLATVFLLRGTPSEHPRTLATESLAANENAKITHALNLLTSGTYNARVKKPKYHGCLKGRFTVISNLPPSLQSALFTPGASYPTWLRFSSHSGHHDTTPDMQGMAIKLFGVPGDKFADISPPETHDFLLGSHPVFMTAGIESYVHGLRAFNSEKPLRYFYNPLNLQINAYRISRELFSTQNDLTTLRWWSMVPYKFNDNQAVKYSVRPCQHGRSPQPGAPRNYGQGTSRNFLSERLAETVRTAALCYEFMVQTQSDSQTMPIEDPTVEWNDTLAPFQPVAQLSLPAQNLKDEAHQKICGELKFHPWQALPAHQPLGGINRARRRIYTHIQNADRP